MFVILRLSDEDSRRISVSTSTHNFVFRSHLSVLCAPTSVPSVLIPNLFLGARPFLRNHEPFCFRAFDSARFLGGLPLPPGFHALNPPRFRARTRILSAHASHIAAYLFSGCPHHSHFPAARRAICQRR